LAEGPAHRAGILAEDTPADEAEIGDVAPALGLAEGRGVIISVI